MSVVQFGLGVHIMGGVLNKEELKMSSCCFPVKIERSFKNYSSKRFFQSTFIKLKESRQEKSPLVVCTIRRETSFYWQGANFVIPAEPSADFMSNAVGTVNFANILPFSEPSFAGLLRPKVELVRDYYLCQSSWKCRGTRLVMMSLGTCQLILKQNSVDNSGMRFDSNERTALAFVTLRADGEREFMFFRNPSADFFNKQNLMKT
ncbi:hypothetical protein H0E87_024261 [Populus deltoides]|uniref:Carbohydrate kinase PfkB domain-containing protein n=1 Tax=Populus deltoides TaxID=3696 RepID=A0A8T2X8R9_POPDE|nr:hypothetical protein H0E87_024261 [Populus deltoides]